MRLSPNFTLAEAVKSQTASRQRIDNTPSALALIYIRKVALCILQPVRDHYMVPISPLSWYRSPRLNAAIGSKPTSQHIKGQAVDFEVPGAANIDVARWIETYLDFDQLILEFWRPDDPSAGWIHCSYVTPDINRREVLAYDGRRFTKGLPA